MLTIKLEKVDELTLLLNDLSSIVYLQSLVQNEINLNSADKNALCAAMFLHHINKQKVKSLCDLVFADDFTQSDRRENGVDE